MTPQPSPDVHKLQADCNILIAQIAKKPYGASHLARVKSFLLLLMGYKKTRNNSDKRPINDTWQVGN